MFNQLTLSNKILFDSLDREFKKINSFYQPEASQKQSGKNIKQQNIQNLIKAQKNSKFGEIEDKRKITFDQERKIDLPVKEKNRHIVNPNKKDRLITQESNEKITMNNLRDKKNMESLVILSNYKEQYKFQKLNTLSNFEFLNIMITAKSTTNTSLDHFTNSTRKKKNIKGGYSITDYASLEKNDLKNDKAITDENFYHSIPNISTIQKKSSKNNIHSIKGLIPLTQLETYSDVEKSNQRDSKIIKLKKDFVKLKKLDKLYSQIKNIKSETRVFKYQLYTPFKRNKVPDYRFSISVSKTKPDNISKSSTKSKLIKKNCASKCKYGTEYNFIQKVKKETISYNRKTGAFLYGEKNGHKIANFDRLYSYRYSLGNQYE